MNEQRPTPPTMHIWIIGEFPIVAVVLLVGTVDKRMLIPPITVGGTYV